MTFGLACDRDGYDLRFPRPVQPVATVPAWAVVAAAFYASSASAPDVPNRLYGVTINEHGEAV